jgi:hypothetical protein
MVFLFGSTKTLAASESQVAVSLIFFSITVLVSLTGGWFALRTDRYVILKSQQDEGRKESLECI